jgi:hypothetical protein
MSIIQKINEQLVMQQVFFLIVSFFCVVHIQAQPSTEKNTVTIIGTIHNGNKYFNYKTLYKKITALKPDIILIEQSEPFKRVFGLQTAAFLGIWHPGIEQRAVQKYYRRNKECMVLPYDTLIPERKKYAGELIRNTDAVMNELANAANSRQMTKEDSLLCAAYIEKRNRWLDFIRDTTLERINQPDVTATIKGLYEKDAPVLSALVSKYVKDTVLVNWQRRENTFWITRNRYMGRQVMSFITQNKGRKIIVLTGLAHTYFIKEFLQHGESEVLMLQPAL